MKIAFLDRDGVINKEVNYLYKIEEFEFVDNAISGLKRLVSNGFEIIVVTNQAGIARGYYSESDYYALTDWYISELKRYGIKILDVFHCPHHPEGMVREISIDCTCRKPKSGLLDMADAKYKIDKNSSIIVGDKESDILAGENFGLDKCYLVNTGHTIPSDVSAKYNVYKDLLSIPIHL